MSKCPSCDSATVNGIFVHELGCPDSYKEILTKCSWCGQSFEADRLHREFCSEDCAEAYYN